MNMESLKPKRKGILLVGGGGHCRSVIDVIEQENIFYIAGIIDSNKECDVFDYKVLGSDEDLPRLRSEFDYALVTVGQIKSPQIRMNIFKKLKKIGFKLPTIISPRAYVSHYAKIGEGSIIMHDCLVNANASVGNNCIINTKVLLEHDCKVGDNCHISTGSIINGGTIVHNNCFFGSNSMAREYIEIQENSVIGGGKSLLYKSSGRR